MDRFVVVKDIGITSEMIRELEMLSYIEAEEAAEATEAARDHSNDFGEGF